MNRLLISTTLSFFVALHASNLSDNSDSTQKYMFEAADLRYAGKPLEASKIYQKLYDDTKDSYFLKQAALTKLQAGLLKEAALSAEEYQNLTKDYDDEDTNLIIAERLIESNDINRAILLLERMNANSPSLNTHYVLANLYMSVKQPLKALPHFIACYEDENASGTTIKTRSLKNIIAIYVDNNQVEDSFKYFDIFLSSNEYDIEIAKFGQEYIQIYTKLNRVDKLIDNLNKRFQENESLENARYLIFALLQVKRNDEAVAFIKNNETLLGRDGKEMLVEIYASNNDLPKAVEILKEIYKESGDYIYLGFSAVYEFELLEHKTKQSLEPIINTLQLSINNRKKMLEQQQKGLNREDAVLYNFMGYLLIDYDINIDDGMKYVEVALSVEPNSVEYIDSLAWGFYKKGNCTKAKEVFDRIPKSEIPKLDELQEHSNVIEKCMGVK